MSANSFISAEQHLAKLKYTVQQAKDFINSNVTQPEIIFAAARNNGVRTDMLSEITSFSTTVIREYFLAAGFDSNKLDDSSLLVSSNLGSLEHLVNFNNRANALSNKALSALVQDRLQVKETYPFTFKPIFDFQDDDGVYDADELGVSHLDNVPATDENLESLFYGSLINVFSALDKSELNQINIFPSNGSSEEFQMLLFNALSEAPPAIVWSDGELADMVTGEAVKIIDKYWWSNVNDQRDILAFSYLGLAIA